MCRRFNRTLCKADSAHAHHLTCRPTVKPFEDVLHDEATQNKFRIIKNCRISNLHNVARVLFPSSSMAGADDITKWQQSIGQEKITEDQPLIAHLYEACSGLYRGILTELPTTLSIDKSVLVSLQRSHSYLVIWGDGYGVSDGLLDSSLDKSRRARGSTLRLLCSVSRTLTKRE